jgi:hypothetical protein
VLCFGINGPIRLRSRPNKKQLFFSSNHRFPNSPQASPPGRVPLDKEKGFVKGKDILSGAEHRLLSTPERVGPRLWGYHRCIIFSGGSLHRAIDSTETTIMIFLFGHPAAESVRKWETPKVFSKAPAPSSA